MAKVNVDLQKTPFIPSRVYLKLPLFLKECCEQFTNQREKDAFLTMALGVISGCLPSVKGIYARRRYHTNLFVLVVAPPANGKGVIRYAKLLGQAIHQRLIYQTSIHDALERMMADEGKEAEKPANLSVKVLYIPADTSAAMLLQHLHNNGGSGIICESEADTLVNTFKQEWGSFSDRQRAAFEHEAISYSRKAGETHYINIPFPRLSVVMTGTQDQAVRLIPSAQNGLASRYIYYLFRQPRQWNDPKPCVECSEPDVLFTAKGEELLKISDFYDQNQLEVRLTASQWATLNKHFHEQLELKTTSHGDDLAPTVYRMGVIVFRMAMIFTALRRWETKQTEDVGECSDEDFESAMHLGWTYLHHAGVMMQMIPGSDAQANVTIKDNFYKELPGARIFARAEAVDIGKNMRLSDRSVDRYLRYFLKYGRLQQIKAGFYKKP